MKTLGDYHRPECPVCVFRASLSVYEVLQLSSEFFGSNSTYIQVDESQYEPLLVKEVLSLLLLLALRDSYN